MSSNTSPPRTPLVGPVNQLHEIVRKQTLKGASQRRRERRKNKTAEVAEVLTDITSSSPQTPSNPTAIADPHGNDLPTSEKGKGAEEPTWITSSTAVESPASRGNDQPISEKAQAAEAPKGIIQPSLQNSALVAPASHTPASIPFIPPPTQIAIIAPPASRRNNPPISEQAKGAGTPTDTTLPPSQPSKKVDKKKGSSQDGREIKKKKEVEGVETPTGITPFSSPPPALVPSAIHLREFNPLVPLTAPPTIVDPIATHGNNRAISASVPPVLPTFFNFGPITNTFGQSPQASLTFPPEIKPKSFTFVPATNTFGQAPPRPQPHKTLTEVEANVRVTTARAEIQSKADQEISALTTKLGESKMESIAAKKDLETTKADLEKSKTELARMKKELKSMQETLKTQQCENAARIRGMATDLDRIIAQQIAERTARQGFEAELAVARDALVAYNKKSSNGPTLALLLLLLALFLLGSSFLLWSFWTSMQIPLAAVSRVDSVHMYPKWSEAWMVMDEFGWFGD